jgi:hypothetical protein
MEYDVFCGSIKARLSDHLICIPILLVPFNKFHKKRVIHSQLIGIAAPLLLKQYCPMLCRNQRLEKRRHAPIALGFWLLGNSLNEGLL